MNEKDKEIYSLPIEELRKGYEIITGLDNLDEEFKTEEELRQYMVKAMHEEE